jgi:hypothetical protein
MEINTEEMFSTDWDWFAVDQEGRLAHFASGGYRNLPKTVRSSKEDLDLLLEYFSGLEVRVRPLVEQHFNEKVAPDGAQLDWSSFIEMAGRGLYSYDTEMTPGATGNYLLVVRPPMPLTLGQLPPDIQSILRRTTLAVDFSRSFRISESET